MLAEGDIKMNKRLIILILIIIAVIWLPTFTPEDLFTSIPILRYFGWKIFIAVGLILIFLLWRFGILKTIFAFLR